MDFIEENLQGQTNDIIKDKRSRIPFLRRKADNLLSGLTSAMKSKPSTRDIQYPNEKSVDDRVMELIQKGLLNSYHNSKCHKALLEGSKDWQNSMSDVEQAKIRNALLLDLLIHTVGNRPENFVK